MILPIIFGMVLGILAGLLPGLHPNSLSQLLTYVEMDNFDAAIMIAVSAAVNTVLSILPAIFLFIPDEQTVLSVLPGQRMVNEGNGLKAVWISGAAVLLSIFFMILFLPVSFFLTPFLYQTISPYIGLVLLTITIVYLFQEKVKEKIVSAFFIFILSGFLGWTLLSSTVLREPLFVSFIGLFALSSMIFAVNKTSIPYQIWIKDQRIKNDLVFIVLVGVLLGGLADLLPAVGSPAQLATFVTPVAAIESSSFLALTSSISISHFVNSFVALNTIDKARIGPTVIIRNLIGKPDLQTTVFFILLSLSAIAISVAILWILTIPLIQFLRKTDLRLLNLGLFLYLAASIIFVDGLLGLFVAVVASAIGTLPVLLGVRRTHLMGFLILPTMVFFLV